MNRNFLRIYLVLVFVMGVTTFIITSGCSEADSDNGVVPRNTDHFAEEPFAHAIELQNQIRTMLSGAMPA